MGLQESEARTTTEKKEGNYRPTHSVHQSTDPLASASMAKSRISPTILTHFWACKLTPGTQENVLTLNTGKQPSYENKVCTEDNFMPCLHVYNCSYLQYKFLVYKLFGKTWLKIWRLEKPEKKLINNLQWEQATETFTRQWVSTHFQIFIVLVSMHHYFTTMWVLCVLIGDLWAQLISLVHL